MITKASVRKPLLMKMWEQYPKTWKFLIDLGILLKYKTLNISKLPNKIVLPSSMVLFVNSEENRGRALLISNGMTQKRLTNFWEKAVSDIKPDLIIDVGVNYGECIFSTTYPEHTKVYGIEANRHLLKFIYKSRDVHPNNSQIEIINAIASDKDDEEIPFFIDKHWSGTSSASYMPAHKMIEKESVKAITINSLVKKDNPYGTVLFKVDVEGYEAFVLKGMIDIFNHSDMTIGFIEFNSEYIEKLGTSVDEFLAFLHTYFTIYLYLENDTIINASQFNYEDLQNLFGSAYIHTDFILTTDDRVIDNLI